MVLSLLIIGLYLGILGAALWLNYRHRDRPVIQAILMAVVSYVLYAFVRRIVLLTGGDAAMLLDDRALVVFWAWSLGWLAWAVWMTERLRRGRSVVGPDGQRWGVLTGRVGGVPVAAAKPMATIVRAQVTAARLAREGKAVTVLTPQQQTGD
jgi:hypothetical protein